MNDETKIVNKLIKLTNNKQMEWTYHLGYNLTKYDTVTIMVFDNSDLVINTERFRLTDDNILNLLSEIDGSYEQDDYIQDTFKRILGW